MGQVVGKIVLFLNTVRDTMAMGFLWDILLGTRIFPLQQEPSFPTGFLQGQNDLLARTETGKPGRTECEF